MTAVARAKPGKDAGSVALLCTRATEDATRRHHGDGSGEEGTKVELDRTWARIKRLHDQRFEANERQEPGSDGII